MVQAARQALSRAARTAMATALARRGAQVETAGQGGDTRWRGGHVATAMDGG